MELGQQIEIQKCHDCGKEFRGEPVVVVLKGEKYHFGSRLCAAGSLADLDPETGISLCWPEVWRDHLDLSSELSD